MTLHSGEIPDSGGVYWCGRIYLYDNYFSHTRLKASAVIRKGHRRSERHLGSPGINPSPPLAKMLTTSASPAKGPSKALALPGNNPISPYEPSPSRSGAHDSFTGTAPTGGCPCAFANTRLTPPLERPAGYPAGPPLPSSINQITPNTHLTSFFTHHSEEETCRRQSFS